MIFWKINGYTGYTLKCGFLSFFFSLSLSLSNLSHVFHLPHLSYFSYLMLPHSLSSSNYRFASQNVAINKHDPSEILVNHSFHRFCWSPNVEMNNFVDMNLVKMFMTNFETIKTFEDDPAHQPFGQRHRSTPRQLDLPGAPDLAPARRRRHCGSRGVVLDASEAHGQ